MHEENNTVGWFHPTSGDSRAVPRGFHSRLIGIYRTIRHFYNIPGHWPQFSRLYAYAQPPKFRIVYSGSFLSIISWQVFLRRCVGLGTRYIYFWWQRGRNIYHERPPESKNLKVSILFYFFN